MIIAIDPGINTGMAFRLDSKEWATITLTRADDLNILEIYRKLLDYTPSDVVIEAYISGVRISHDGLETIELVGAVRGFCEFHNIKLHRQTPSQRKMYEPTAKLLFKERKAKLGSGFTHTDHEVSALAHLLTWERLHK